MKLSPVSRAAGGGRMEIVRTCPAASRAARRTARARGTSSVGLPESEVPQSGRGESAELSQ